MGIHHRLGLALGAVLVLASYAAAEDYRLPPAGDGDGIDLTDFLKVRPHARVWTYYTTNLFQEPNRRKEEDVGVELSGGLDLLIGKEDGDSNLSLGYTATQLLFVKNPKQNTVEHRLRFNGNAALGKMFTLKANGSASWLATNTDPRFRGRVRNFQGFGGSTLEFRPTETVGFMVDGDVTYSHNYPDAFERFNSLTSRVGAFVILNPRLPGDIEIIAGSNWRQIHYVDHKQITQPDLEFVSWQAGVQADNDLMVLSLRAGYETGYVKKRRNFGRPSTTGSSTFADDVPDGLFASGSFTLTPNQTTSLTLYGLHQVGFSAVSDSQRNTNVGANLSQKIPVLKGLHAFCGASWSLQDPRRSPETRTQTYLAGVGYSPLAYLDFGTQFSYLRTSSRTGGFETFEAGLSITLKL